MHSSRMRTVCNSCRLLEGVPGPGGGCLVPGVCSQGVSGPGGVPVPGGSAPGRGGIPACTEADPPVNRITDRCKNITFATSLWT